MTDPSPYAAAIVHHHTPDDLARCLASLRAQKLPPALTVVVDNDGCASHGSLRPQHPQSTWLVTPNLGYAGGANRALAEIAGREPACRYVLLLNPDVELHPGHSERMVSALDARPRAVLAGGKLLRGDSGRIDSAGIVMPRHRRPRDRGSEDLDRGQYDREETVFAASGAALWLRRAALEDLAVGGEIFDEDFFVYHEDTDLCWRAWRLGWEVLYVPDAVATHARRWRRERRFETPIEVRRHSFKNHYLELIKNERVVDLLRHAPALVLWEILRLAHALLRDPAVLPAYCDAWRLAPRALRKRRQIARRARGRAGLAPIAAMRRRLRTESGARPGAVR